MVTGWSSAEIAQHVEAFSGGQIRRVLPGLTYARILQSQEAWLVRHNA